MLNTKVLSINFHVFLVRSLAMMTLLLFSLIPAFTQDKLPEYGDIADIKNFQKVFVVADSTATRKFIVDELKKYPALVIVSSPDEAEFVLECKQNGHIVIGGLIQEEPTFEMTVYTLKNNRHRVAWSETKTSLRPAPALLARDFIKALKKVRGEKK